MNSFSKTKPLGMGSMSFRIAITYFLVGAFWILFSDKTAGLLIRNQRLLTTVSMIKGWGFVSVTALMLYAMMGRWASRIERSQEEARASEVKYRKLVRPWRCFGRGALYAWKRQTLTPKESSR
jgi:hypothetical protein